MIEVEEASATFLPDLWLPDRDELLTPRESDGGLRSAEEGKIDETANRREV